MQCLDPAVGFLYPNPAAKGGGKSSRPPHCPDAYSALLPSEMGSAKWGQRHIFSENPQDYLGALLERKAH